jgi:Fe2+ transport system protein FeoA
MNKSNLALLKSGEQGIVAELGRAQINDRLRELGLIPGTWVKVVMAGSPMLIQAGETRICLRREDARLIEIETRSSLAHAQRTPALQPLPSSI